jgi:hypothetical protein
MLANFPLKDGTDQPDYLFALAGTTSKGVHNVD